MSTITFIASGLIDRYNRVLHYHEDIRYNLHNGDGYIEVSNLSFLCFDLLKLRFIKIQLYYKGEIYQLNLGKNSWTDKDLRESHNLLKIVRSYIIEENERVKN